MAAILEPLHRNLRLRGRTPGAVLVAALLVAAATGAAQAQDVAASVDGEPITQLDIDQRGRLLELSSATHKAPSRQEVLYDLAKERLMIQEGKRRGIDPSDSDVDSVLAAAAQRFHQSTEQFIQTLTKAGVAPVTYRARLRADLVGQALGE
jgi:peptidyl-prolyl cis-trans isomerase SurA